MKSLIIGKGQIGNALHYIFSGHHECYIRDVNPERNDPAKVEVLHIAFPYSENFVDNVSQYIQYYRPLLTIIHSSVAIGTTDKIGQGCIHSPERGRHPNLAYEMKQFPKFIASGDANALAFAKGYFDKCGWKTVQVNDPDITEALKLISNVHLGLEIAWRQEVSRMIPSDYSDIYDQWEDSYNLGHEYMGHRHLIRPRMKEDPIGGHCILPCLDILKERFSSKAFQFIEESNAKAKRKTQEESGVVNGASRAAADARDAISA